MAATLEEEAPQLVLPPQPEFSPSLNFETPSTPGGSSLVTIASPLPASHPISRKLRQIFSADHDPETTKAALETLAQMYPADGCGEGRGETKQKVDIAAARTNLNNDVQRALAESTKTFLDVLAGVDSHVQVLDSKVAEMRAHCEDVDKHLTAARSATRYLLEHAEGIQRQRASVAERLEATDAFLTRYTISDSELAMLQSREVIVTPAFFALIDRLTAIRSDAQSLLEGTLTATGGGTRAGTDVMDTAASHLETAYAKLLQYCTFEFRQPVKEGAEVGSTLREAVRRLAEKEDLLRPALGTLASTRAASLQSAFIAALTIGGPAPSYLPRPIELHAHDPLRYVGDMLAWVHQALASEREWLASLFLAGGDVDGYEEILDEGEEVDGQAQDAGKEKAYKVRQRGRRIGERRRGLEGSLDLSQTERNADGSPLGRAELVVRELLDRTMEGCCRPLKVRVEQTVKSQEGCLTTLRLANLVDFYRVTMERTVGSRAALSQTLRELGTTTFDVFKYTLQRQAAGLRRYDGSPSPELDPPPPLTGVAETLKEILVLHQSSVTDEAETNAAAGVKTKAEGELSFNEALSTIIVPMLDMCTTMAATKIAREGGKGAKAVVEGGRKFRIEATASSTQLSKAARECHIFLLNCFGYMKDLLSPYTFAEEHTQSIRGSIIEEALDLIAAHYHDLLEESGLTPLIAALDRQTTEKSPLSHDAGASPDAVRASLSALTTFLGSPTLLHPSRLSLLRSPALRGAVHTAALRRVADAYGRVVDAVRDPANRYEWRETLVGRSKEEVALLLGLGSAEGEVEGGGEDKEGFERAHLAQAVDT